MKCPQCQFENPEGFGFCGKCGQELTPSIGHSPQTYSIDEKIDKIQRYLPKGLTNKILAQRGKIEGERKHVTVMFCDMEGFTPMVEKLGQEKAYSVMDQVYEILIHKVHDFGGTVNEMTGDGIMALFGAPIALEDAPQRALRSALAIHQEIDTFNGNKKGIDSIKMRIGVHTGPVVVGTLGNDLRVEFKAVGDTVNLASRMEGIAEPGTTYVTKDTFKLTEGLFRFEPLGQKILKGRQSPIPVYKLLYAKKDVQRPRLGSERIIYSEMVGRVKELDKLEFQVMKAIQGEGSIVNIIGEAGIGKSRLMAELKDRDVMKRVSLFEGRAISTGRNLSFHPIIDFLKHWALIGEDDSGATALTKLETSIKRVYPEGVHEVLPFVATLMGMRLSGRYAERVKGIEGEALEKLILKNIRDLIIKATEQGPLVIVTEDLHWADTSSIELMESLFRLAETQRILFINVFRPDHKETGDRIVETLRESFDKYYVEIGIQPLDERMSETLINNMLNIKGFQYAVIGRSFFYRILKEMTKTIENIDNRLSHLQEIQLFQERKRMEEIEYLFKHALALEAAYESILSDVRKELHLKVAESIDKVFKERLHEFYGMLAYHYSKGEDLDKAEEYMIKAGEEALGSSASREALRYYQEALSLYLNKYGETADPEKLAMLEKNIALALYNKGEMEESLVYFDRVLKRWGIKPPQNKILILIKFLFDLLGILFYLYLPSKRSRKVPTQKDRDIFFLSYKKDVTLVVLDPMRLYAEMFASAKRILRFDFKNIENWSWTLICISAGFSMMGFFMLSNKVLQYVEGFTDKNNLLELFPLEQFRALHNIYLGKWDDIHDPEELLLDGNLKTGQFFNVSMHLLILGLIKIYQGKFNKAYQIIEKLSKIADNYEYKYARQNQLSLEFLLFLSGRKLNDAQKIIETYESLFKAGSDMNTLALLGDKAELQIWLNDFNGAEKTLRQAKEIFIKQTVVTPAFAIGYFRSRFILDVRLLEESIFNNNKTDIKKYDKQAYKSSKKLWQNSKKLPAMHSLFLCSVARYHWLMGKQNKAVKSWKKAIEEEERLGAWPDLARTYMEIGKRFLEEQSKYKELEGITAKEYLEKARVMFQEMDLQWDMDELDKIAITN